MPTTAQLRDRLLHIGWAETRLGSDRDLLELAADLGRPGPSRPKGPLVDRLVPLTSSQAHPRSMSRVFGEGLFPFHTDLAHSSSPPRFVLLRAEHADHTGCQTLLHDLKRLPLTSADYQLLVHSPFLVRGGSRPFLSAILNRAPRSRDVIIRYDPCCMTPASRPARNAQLLLTRKTTEVRPVQIAWYRDRTIVLDNWRVLHARTPAHRVRFQGRVRTLRRVLVWSTTTTLTN